MTTCRVCTATTDGFVCRACVAELERAIAEMPSLIHEVSNVATRQTRVYRANGRPDDLSDETRRWAEEQADIPAWLRSREGRVALPATALMVNLEARDLLWTAGNTLSTWARHLAESRGAELPTSDNLVAWLLTNVQAARWDEAGAEMHDEITYLRSRMTHAVDRSPSRIYAGPCHAETEAGKCERPLYAWPNADEIVCDGYGVESEYDVGCRAEHTPAERQDWLLAELTWALLPLDMWREALPRMMPHLAWPTRSTWWRWAYCEDESRRRLVPKGLVGDVETFAGGDVIELVEQEQARIVGNRQRADRARRSA